MEELDIKKYRLANFYGPFGKRRRRTEEVGGEDGGGRRLGRREGGWRKGGGRKEAREKMEKGCGKRVEGRRWEVKLRRAGGRRREGMRM